MRFLRASLLLLVLLLLLASGCGKSATLVPVSGRVMLDNKPLAKAKVQFAPANPEGDPKLSPVSVGETDDQGNFTLKTLDGRDGAVPGQHRVEISKFDRDATIIKGGVVVAEGVERVPEDYNIKSKLTFTVPEGGTKEANFLDLKGGR